MNRIKFTNKSKTAISVIAVFILIVAMITKSKNKKISAHIADKDGTMAETSNCKTISFITKTKDNTLGKSITSTKTNPIVTPEIIVENRTVHYTPGGKSYHYSKDCRTLARSKIILHAKLSEVIKSGKINPCVICVK